MFLRPAFGEEQAETLIRDCKQRPGRGLSLTMTATGQMAAGTFRRGNLWLQRRRPGGESLAAIAARQIVS